MRFLAAAPLVLLLAAPRAVLAGPPFLTDDPEPTDTGHWEIYAPLLEGAGKGRDFEGAAGAEINYGAARDVQVTVGVPFAYAHDAEGYETGLGDLELSVKYRFFHDETEGVSVAAFPGITLPTGTHGLGAHKVTALLPIWVQKDAGPWSLFGGGGYAINPGHPNRDFWSGGLAVTRQVADHLSLSVEVFREGADTDDGHAATSLGLGAVIDLKPPLRLLGSVGPTFVDSEGSPAFHAFLALGLDF